MRRLGFRKWTARVRYSAVLWLAAMVSACGGGDDGSVALAGLNGNGSMTTVNAMATVIVELNGTDDWADPTMDPKQPPLLRIPQRYLPAHMSGSGQDKIVARNIDLRIPVEDIGLPASGDSLERAFATVSLSEAADGWAQRVGMSIQAAVRSHGSVRDESTGLHRVLVDDSPGYSVRYRYFRPDASTDLEYVHLDCVFYENDKRRDACLMQLMPRQNVVMSLHFDAADIADWRGRADGMRKLAEDWD